VQDCNLDYHRIYQFWIARSWTWSGSEKERYSQLEYGIRVYRRMVGVAKDARSCTVARNARIVEVKLLPPFK